MAKRATGRKGNGGHKKDLTGKKAGRSTKAEIRAAADAINVADKKEKILAAMAYIDDRVARRKVLNEEVQAKRDELQAIGVEKKAFDWARKLVAMDPEDRDAMLVSLGLSLEARGLGRQMDMFGTGEPAAAGENDPDDHCDRADAEGFRAAADGAFKTENPHAPDTAEHDAWNSGWDRQTAAHVQSMGPEGEGATQH